jgi:hypothetical protein
MKQATIAICNPMTSNVNVLSRPLGAGAGYMYVSMFGAAVVAGVEAHVAVAANTPENGRIAAFDSAWDTTEGALTSQARTCTTKKNNSKTNKRPQSWSGAPPG